MTASVPPSPPLASLPSRWDVAPSARVRWGIPDAVAVLALIPVVYALGWGFLWLFPDTAEQPFNLFDGLFNYLLLGAGIVAVSRWRGQRSLAADFGLVFRWIDLPIGIGLALLAKFASIVYGLFVIVITGETPKTPNVTVSDDDLYGILTAILLVTLLGPIIEELLFRGLILRATRYAIVRGRRRARPQPAPRRVQVWAAIVSVVVNSVLFGALHLYQAVGDSALFIVLALSTVTIGILNSVIVVVTRRLGAAIIAHIVGNGIAVLLQFAVL